MAYILNIESSTKNCSVSISKNHELLCLCEEYDQKYGHFEKLHTFIQWALEGAEISINQIDAICVAKGPGSYTGLRIGVSAAKGLCYALDIPLLSVETLDVLAQSECHESYDFFIPMLDARRMEVYTKTFNAKKEVVKNTEALKLDESSYEQWKQKKIIFLGDGAEKANQILKLPYAEFRGDVHPSAQHMIELSYTKFLQKQFEDVAYFEPFYLKNFIAGKPKKSLLK